jgi:hypothetical protein
VAKKKKDFSGDPGGLIGDAIWSAVKPIYKEAKRQERSSRSRRRESGYFDLPPTVSKKEIIFRVLPQAIRNAGTNFSRRDLFYATRPLAYAHRDWKEDEELAYGYFSQGLLTEYQEIHGAIQGLWTDPRGNMVEPHTGKTVPLGTIEIRQYDFPEYVFNKILYIEKEGELSKVKAAQLGERYDMAVCSGKGQPTEAVRTLFARAERGNYDLYVFHDADLDGYSIARTMREATRRMPYHNVNVVDIGLTVEDALEMGLDSEPFHRSKDISWELRMSLSDVAKEYLYDKDPYGGGITGERFELNAILPDFRRIQYIEDKLAEHGVTPKLIPPAPDLQRLGKKMYQAKVDEWVQELVVEILGMKDLKKEMGEKFEERFKLGGAERWIETAFSRDDSQPWRKALNDTLQAAYTRKHKDALRSDVLEHVKRVAQRDE